MYPVAPCRGGASQSHSQHRTGRAHLPQRRLGGAWRPTDLDSQSAAFPPWACPLIWETRGSGIVLPLGVTWKCSICKALLTCGQR